MFSCIRNGCCWCEWLWCILHLHHTGRIIGTMFFPVVEENYYRLKVKLSLCLTNWTLRHVGLWGSGCIVGGEWSASRPGRFTPRKRTPGTYCRGGWVEPRTRLDDVEKRKFVTLPELELRLLGRPAHSQSLYRLRYPGSSENDSTHSKKNRF
jgi:hypothetical protein